MEMLLHENSIASKGMGDVLVFLPIFYIFSGSKLITDLFFVVVLVAGVAGRNRTIVGHLAHLRL